MHGLEFIFTNLNWNRYIRMKSGCQFGNFSILLRISPNSEAGLSVAATPRRRKVPATPSSPVAAAIMPLPEKMRRGRRYHPAATRRRRYFRLTASEFGISPASFHRQVRVGDNANHALIFETDPGSE
jgi:hypothetical protein